MKKEAEQGKNNVETNQESVAGTSVNNQNDGLGQKEKSDMKDSV